MVGDPEVANGEAENCQMKVGDDVRGDGMTSSNFNLQPSSHHTNGKDC